MDFLNKNANWRPCFFPLLFSTLLLAGCLWRWSPAVRLLAHTCTCPAVQSWNPVFMDFVSRVQPEGSPSQNSVPKIFADIFQNLGSTPHNVLSVTKGTDVFGGIKAAFKFYGLEAEGWAVLGELWFLQFPNKLVSPLRKRSCSKFKNLRRLTHQVTVHTNTWIQMFCQAQVNYGRRKEIPGIMRQINKEVTPWWLEWVSKEEERKYSIELSGKLEKKIKN